VITLTVLLHGVSKHGQDHSPYIHAMGRRSIKQSNQLNSIVPYGQRAQLARRLSKARGAHFASCRMGMIQIVITAPLSGCHYDWVTAHPTEVLSPAPTISIMFQTSPWRHDAASSSRNACIACSTCPTVTTLLAPNQRITVICRFIKNYGLGHFRRI
jgi:hypothetical protein